MPIRGAACASWRACRSPERGPRSTRLSARPLLAADADRRARHVTRCTTRRARCRGRYLRERRRRERGEHRQRWCGWQLRCAGGRGGPDREWHVAGGTPAQMQTLALLTIQGGCKAAPAVSARRPADRAARMAVRSTSRPRARFSSRAVSAGGAGGLGGGRTPRRRRSGGGLIGLDAPQMRWTRGGPRRQRRRRRRWRSEQHDRQARRGLTASPRRPAASAMKWQRRHRVDRAAGGAGGGSNGGQRRRRWRRRRRDHRSSSELRGRSGRTSRRRPSRAELRAHLLEVAAGVARPVARAVELEVALEVLLAPAPCRRAARA